MMPSALLIPVSKLFFSELGRVATSFLISVLIWEGV